MNRTIGICLFALVLAACTNSGSGAVQVFVEPEDSIPEGLEPGDGGENIKDGWSVEYDRFLITIGNFRARSSAEPDEALESKDVYVVDLRNVPAGGLVIATFEDAPAVRFDKVGFDLLNTPAGALRAEGTAAQDHARMADNGWSLEIGGRITKDTQTIRFAWGLAVGTSFDDCAPLEGDAGFAVPSGGTVQVKPTIHGDHWFFTNVTQGAEITERRAAWIASADLDGDGETTLDELRSVPAAAAFPAGIYNLSGALIPIDTAYDYLEAQARTLGDFQGEGECPTRARLP